MTVLPTTLVNPTNDFSMEIDMNKYTFCVQLWNKVKFKIFFFFLNAFYATTLLFAPTKKKQNTLVEEMIKYKRND